METSKDSYEFLRIVSTDVLSILHKFCHGELIIDCVALTIAGIG